MYRTTIVFKQGPKTVAEVVGPKFDHSITLAEVGEKVLETEAFLERITGLRTHINIERIG